jgi:GT2 family glycosyltransferase
MDSVPAQFAHSLATLTSYGIEDTEISIWFNLGSLVYTSRNEIAKRALLDEADLVMWFDSDMVFNPDTLYKMLKLIDAGHDMVTGIYYRRTLPFTPTVFKTMDIDDAKQEAVWTEFETLPDEPFEVAACGFGCVLMRSVIFVDVFAKFGNMFSPIGNVGEDIAFCWRARECGYKIIADPSIGLGHVGHTIITKEFFENYQSAQKKKAERGE